MKALVDYYLLSHQNCAAKRVWANWPFHNIYDYRTAENGGMKCTDKWRDMINTNMSVILAETDFDRLYAMLTQWAKGVPGIGSLHVYDPATCFLHPNDVHLNCGALEAAKAINLPIKNGAAPYASFVAYDGELGRLTPLQLEDFLCINKKVFLGKQTPAQQLQQHKTLVVRYRRSCKSGTSTTTSKKGGCNRP